MAKNKYTLLFFLLVPVFIFAQTNPGKYIIYFKDKPADKNVSTLFSDKALERRMKFNITFDERDYRVNADYVEQIKNKAVVLNTSNWLNAVLVNTEINIKEIEQLPFVSSVVKVEKTCKSGIASVELENECTTTNTTETFEDNYSSSFSQFHLLNGEYLHEQGLNGENMTIAICDAGFKLANTNAAFSQVFSENRLLGHYDYVHNDSTVFTSFDADHGAFCFSIIAALKNNQYIGASSKSKFYLFQTENVDGNSERLQEEFNLATALQRCDQLGVDVVSISLGYTTFDVASENHDTSDMKKNNTPAAKAVNMASSKGMLVVVAAGNEGAKAWHYISTPADADSAFAIAAVDINGNAASFSGYGLATDTRVKPNVAAVGSPTVYVNTLNQIASGNGTSFACPTIAGFSACLWQAFPSKTNWEIKTAIEQSASQYLTPDKHVGYGIPDFSKAYQILVSATFVSNKSLENDLSVYPNPFQSTVIIEHHGNTTIQSVNVLNNVGQTIYSVNAPSENTFALNDLPKGMYLLQIVTNNGMFIKKLIKD